MTLQQIKDAVRKGKTVCWASPAYRVLLHTFKDGREQWLIRCLLNGSCIGLAHLDEVTMNGKPEEFYLLHNEDTNKQSL